MADVGGRTPLHCAATKRAVVFLNGFQKTCEDVVKLLLDRGANPNGRDNNGETPLHGAAENGNTNVVKLLLARGSDPNMADNFEFTPLHKAANNRHKYVYQVLLDRGADPNKANQFGNTPRSLMLLFNWMS